MRMFISAVLTACLLLSPNLHAADTININTADAQTLAKALNGVGIKRAESIVAYRTANGPFKSVDELAKVDGIGRSTIEKNKANLVVK